jgi:DivIVA domain-containing protein
VLTVLSILGVLAVLFVAAAVATREGPVLADAPVDAADVQLPDGPLQPEDLRAVRFALAVRGYRMDEVDRVIERAATELATRDERIAALERTPADASTSATTVAVDSPLASVVLKPAPATPPAGADEPSAAEPPSTPAEPAEPIVPTGTPQPVPAAAAPAEPDMSEVPDVPDEPSEPDTDAAAGLPVVAEQVSQEPVASLLNDPDPEDDCPSASGVPEGEEPDSAPDTPADADSAPDTPADAEAAVDVAPADDEARSVPPPPPPPIEVALVRTEVAPVPTAVRLPAADEDDSSAT